MLIELRTRPRESSDRPSGLLFECHARIRQFTQIAIALAEVLDAPALEVADAARRVHRYFTVALPLHSDDEDLSVRPRLLATAHASEVRDAVETIASEHHRIHGVIARLAPRWALVVTSPASLREHASALADDAEALRVLWENHLSLEERVVFPAIDRLEPSEQRAILDEMRARRPARSFT